LQTPSGFAQETDQTTKSKKEIIEDLVDATTRVAYRMQILGQYEELSVLVNNPDIDLLQAMRKAGAYSEHTDKIVSELQALEAAINEAEDVHNEWKKLK